MADRRLAASMASASAAIEAVRASKLFQDGAVVSFQGLTLSVAHNDVLCIVGPSGCGKTTFLRCVAGLTNVSTGELRVHGMPVNGPPEGVAMVFQQFGLLPWKTVFDNAAFGLAVAGSPRATIRDRVQHYIELVGLLPWKTVFDNAAFGLAVAGSPRATIRDRVQHYIELVGLLPWKTVFDNAAF